MAVEFWQQWGTTHKKQSGASAATVIYFCKGSYDSQDIIDALEDSSTGIPSSYEGLPRSSISLSEAPSKDGIWIATVKYQQTKQPPSVGDEVISYRSSTTTERLYASLSTVATYGSNAPDYDGAINVVTENGENRVEGVDVYSPSMTMVVKKRLSSMPSTSTLRGYYALTCHTNNATFKGWAAGELLFLDFSVNQINNDEYEITYEFLVSPNKSSFYFGDINISSGKKGWEYLWGRFENEEDSTNHATIPRPSAAYVEKVYEAADFTSLGLSASE